MISGRQTLAVQHLPMLAKHVWAWPMTCNHESPTLPTTKKKTLSFTIICSTNNTKCSSLDHEDVFQSDWNCRPLNGNKTSWQDCLWWESGGKKQSPHSCIHTHITLISGRCCGVVVTTPLTVTRGVGEGWQCFEQTREWCNWVITPRLGPAVNKPGSERHEGSKDCPAPIPLTI